MTRKNRIHMDASKPGQVGRTGLCGWVLCDTETDVSKVDCKDCLKAIAKEQRADEPTDADVAAELAPKAGPPPRLTAPLWAASCKGGEHRHCGECVICVWEREANKWGDRKVSAHNREHRVKKPESAPRWSSLGAALIAFADWERHDRHGKSASAGIFARIEFGAIDGGPLRSGDAQLDAAGEFSLMRAVIEAACPEGAHAVLSRAQCMTLLLVRTPGVETVMPTYEQLAERFSVTVGDLTAVVRSVRRRVGEDLAERGLIPAPRPMARRDRGGSCRQAASRF